MTKAAIPQAQNKLVGLRPGIALGNVVQTRHPFNWQLHTTNVVSWVGNSTAVLPRQACGTVDHQKRTVCHVIFKSNEKSKVIIIIVLTYILKRIPTLPGKLVLELETAFLIVLFQNFPGGTWSQTPLALPRCRHAAPKISRPMLSKICVRYFTKLSKTLAIT